jgi:hypothetical protein
LGASVSLPAAAHAYDAMTAFPLGTTRVVLLISVIIALGGIAAGNDRIRSWARSVDKPRWLIDSSTHRWIRAHRRPLQWATLAIGLLVVVIWNNTTPRVAVVTVVIALAVVGLIGIAGSGHEVLVRAPVGPGGGPNSSETPGSSDKPTSATGESANAAVEANADPRTDTDAESESG